MTQVPSRADRAAEASLHGKWGDQASDPLCSHHVCPLQPPQSCCCPGMAIWLSHLGVASHPLTPHLPPFFPMAFPPRCALGCHTLGMSRVRHQTALPPSLGSLPPPPLPLPSQRGWSWLLPPLGSSLLLGGSTPQSARRCGRGGLPGETSRHRVGRKALSMPHPSPLDTLGVCTPVILPFCPGKVLPVSA